MFLLPWHQSDWFGGFSGVLRGPHHTLQREMTWRDGWCACTTRCGCHFFHVCFPTQKSHPQVIIPSWKDKLKQKKLTHEPIIWRHGKSFLDLRKRPWSFFQFVTMTQNGRTTGAPVEIRWLYPGRWGDCPCQLVGTINSTGNPKSHYFENQGHSYLEVQDT